MLEQSASPLRKENINRKLRFRFRCKENAYRLMLRVKFRSNVWAGRSAWYDRHVGIVEAAGSNPAPSTFAFILADGTYILNEPSQNTG